MHVKLAMLTAIFFIRLCRRKFLSRLPDFTPSVSKKVSLNIHSLNYLRQILWWQKIQTADFGSLWNTCQFAHFLLSTRFRQHFFFAFWIETQAGEDPKKKERKKQNFNHKMFLLQAYFANLKFLECDSECCRLQCTRPYFYIFFWNLSSPNLLFHRLYFFIFLLQLQSLLNWVIYVLVTAWTEE